MDCREHKNNERIFYLLQFNRSFSRLGFYFLLVVITWYILSTTASIFLTGMVGVSLTVAGLLSAPITGSLVDRFHKGRLLLFSTIGELFSYILLSIVLLSGSTLFYIAYVIMGIAYFMINLGGLSAYTITPILVGENRLVFANSLTEITLTLSETLGAVLGGFALLALGRYTYLLLFAILLLMVSLIFIIPIIGVKDAKNDREATRPEEFADTWKATFSFIRSKLLPILVFSVTLNSILVILDILGAPLVFYSIGGGPEIYGLFVGSYTLGGLVGATLIPMIRIQRIWILVLGYFSVTGVSLLAIGVLKSEYIVISLPFFIGVMSSFSNIPLMSYLQRIIPKTILGKTTSFMDSVGTGLSPISATIMSLAGNVYGVDSVFAVSGVFLLLITLIMPITSIRNVRQTMHAEEIKE